MVALRTKVFVSESNEVQSNNRVCVKQELFDSKILQSRLFKVLRIVCLLSWNIGHRRRKWGVDSILEPQLQSGFKQFWKLYLSLCSRKKTVKKTVWFRSNKFKNIVFENTKIFWFAKVRILDLKSTQLLRTERKNSHSMPLMQNLEKLHFPGKA